MNLILGQKAMAVNLTFVVQCPLLSTDLSVSRRSRAILIHDELAHFRFFLDSNETGAGYCPICGHFGDGIALLQWFLRRGFWELLEIAEA